MARSFMPETAKRVQCAISWGDREAALEALDEDMPRTMGEELLAQLAADVERVKQQHQEAA